MRRVQLAVFALSLVALASAGGASAKPTWLAPRDLSLPGGSAESPQVALDAAGNALVVWYRWSGQVSVVQAAEHRAGGTWGAPRNLSPPGSAAYYPQLAVNAAGDAVAVWVGSSETGANVVQAAARSGGGAWGRAEDLAAGNDPQVALAPDGTAVAVWERFDGATSVVQAAIRPPGWPWSAPRDLSAPGAYAAYQQVALDHHGNAVAVWRRFDGANWIVQAAAYPSGGGWSAPQSLSAPGQDAEAPQVALDRYGNAIAVWRRFDGANWIVQTAFRPNSLRGGGVWSAPQDLSTPRYDARGPEVAFDAYGHALAIWTRNEDTVQVDERPVGGPWEPAQDLVAPGFLTDDAHVALNSAGDAIAVWRRSETGEHGIVQAARRPAGGVWGAPQVLSPAGQAAFDPQVDVDPAGNALAAWSRFGSGPDNVVQADPLDAAGPIFRGLSVPARSIPGHRFFVSVDPFDVWSAQAEQPHWSFGDGTEDDGYRTEHVYWKAGRYRLTVSQSDIVGNVTSASRTVSVRPICVVPSVVGKTLARAKAAIARRHCHTGRVERQFSSTVTAGHVFAQRPPAGRRVAKGTRVNLVVSRGPRHRTS